MYVIQCTADRLPFSRAGEYLAFRNSTQESWADNSDFAQRFATQQQALDAIAWPASEAVVTLPAS